MKYSININQAGIADAGFADKTDIIDWAIVDYIFGWQNNPTATKIGALAWISYKHLIGEMPLLGLKTKQAVSARMAKLKLLGLIAVEYDKEKRLYACLSEAAHNAIVFRVDRQRNDVGVHENGQPVHENGQGGVHENGHTAVNQESREAGNQEPKDNSAAFDAFWKAYPRKKNRAAAIKAFKRITPDLLPTLFADIEARIRVGDWRLDQPEFIPHPATYLNGERWTDSITPRGQTHEATRQLDRPRSPGERFAALRAAQQAASRGDGQTLDGDAQHFRPSIREQLRSGAVERVGDDSGWDHPQDDRRWHRANEID